MTKHRISVVSTDYLFPSERFSLLDSVRLKARWEGYLRTAEILRFRDERSFLLRVERHFVGVKVFFQIPFPVKLHPEGECFHVSA